MNDDDAEARARGRFMLMNLARLGGLAMVLIGLAIHYGKFPAPQLAGYVLMPVGLVDILLPPEVPGKQMAEPRPVKRFYKQVTVEPIDGGWGVLLDGRMVKTQADAPQVVPIACAGRSAGSRMVAAGRRDRSRGLPHARHGRLRDRRGGGRARGPIADILRLCRNRHALLSRRSRRAALSAPAAHVGAGADRVWKPATDLRFERVSGILHRPQPPATLERLEEAARRAGRVRPLRARRARLAGRLAGGRRSRRWKMGPTWRRCGPPPIARRTGRPNNGAGTQWPRIAAPGGWPRSPGRWNSPGWLSVISRLGRSLISRPIPPLPPPPGSPLRSARGRLRSPWAQRLRLPLRTGA